MKIKYVLEYLHTVLVHKVYVLYYMTKCGFPLQGLVHDLSKFSYTEFVFNVKYMDGSGESPITVAKRATGGYSKAWLHHKRNAHHYEYWEDNFDRGGFAVRMEFRYAVEMICDMFAANKAYGKGKIKYPYFSTYQYWLDCKYCKIAMHPDSQKYINTIFRQCAQLERDGNAHLVFYAVLNKRTLKKIFNEINKFSNNPIQYPIKDIIDPNKKDW